MVSRLEALWSAKARYTRFQITDLWRSWRLHRRYDLRMVDPARLVSVIPRYQAPACRFCDEICCIGPRNIVTLRLRDVASLIDMGLEEVIDTRIQRIPRAGSAAMREFLGTEIWSRFPKLKQTPEGRCVLLTPEGRCRIYGREPLACRRFPFALSSDRRRVFYSPRCRSHTISHANRARYQQHIEAVAANYNEMIKELVLLYHAPRELRILGLDRFLIPRR